ncbi:MAG: acyltransferase family protein, partial [Nocardioides sp.]
MPASASPRLPARLDWADVAKGACIVLVVLHHATTKQYDALVPAHLTPVADAWTWLTQVLKPVRMPLFFVISGFFAASAVHRPWSRVTRRIATSSYLYVVWLLLLAAFTTWERELPMNRVQNLDELALDLVFASTGLWFLYSLAVYFVLVRLTSRLPAVAVLAATTVLAAVASLFPIEEANRVSVLMHLAYFVLGARFPELVRRAATWSRPGALPALTVAFVLASVLLEHAGLPMSVDVVLLSVVGLPWGVLLAVRATRAPRTTTALSWVGRRTLPVYVLHIPVLGVVHHLGLGPDLGPDASALLLATTYPLVVTTLVVA